MTVRDPAAGVTLVETVVALAIFALIGGAGYTMLDQVLRTDARTSGRLDRLGDLQRTLFVIGQDLGQADGQSVVHDRGLALVRDGVALLYRVEGGALWRDVGNTGQVLVDGVEDVRWRFLADGRWQADPPAGAGRPRNPQGVEMVLILPGGQEVRQVSALPAEVD